MPRLSPVLVLFLLMMNQLSFLVSADPPSKVTKSIFDSTDGTKIEGSIVAVAAILAGGAMVVMGYRLFRATLFVVGFVVGGVGHALIAEYMLDDYSWYMTASWIAFVVGGLIGGGFIMSLYLVGIFVVGGAAGIVGAMIILNSAGYAVYPSHPEVVLIGLCIVLGLIGGVLAIKLEKPFLILATSFFGAGILVWGVGYFVGDFPSSNDLKKYATLDANGDWVYSIPSTWWGYVAGINVLLVLGMFIQRKTAGDGIYHKPSVTEPDTEEVQYMEVESPKAHSNDPGSHV